MYENTSIHNENGTWQMIFGVNTLPEYRKQGYATKIEDELFKMRKEPIFSQILEDNKASVAMHKKNDWKFNRYKIYWLFNKSF